MNCFFCFPFWDEFCASISEFVTLSELVEADANGKNSAFQAGEPFFPVICCITARKLPKNCIYSLQSEPLVGLCAPDGCCDSGGLHAKKLGDGGDDCFSNLRFL